MFIYEAKKVSFLFMPSSFSQYELSQEILAALEQLEYHAPTPVQVKVIPEILAGRDVLAKSQTGSGKTASFGIPLCQLVDWNENKPQALVLAPTRELAMQVKEDIFHIGRFKRINVPVLFGRSPFYRQVQALRQKTHIVVGTPGRVLDHMERKTLDTSAIRYLVIDEADEMLNMGFLEQVQSIIQHLPGHPVTLLFSATMPREIERLARTYLQNPARVEIQAQTVTVDRIRQTAFRVQEGEKVRLLQDVLVLQNPESCIMFCNTQDKVERVFQALRESDIPCGRLHGGMEQDDRIAIMNRFRRGDFRYLVATDVAARGIDIDHVTHVINYDMPRAKEHYVHRIGRTGRNGRRGIAVTFYTKEETQSAQELQRYTNSRWIFVLLPEAELVEQYRPAFLERLRHKPKFKPAKGEAFRNSIVKLHINAGRKTKLRPVDVIGSICAIKGVSASDIGIIDVQSISTFVDILNNKGHLVLEALQNRPIKGRQRRVSIAGN